MKVIIHRDKQTKKIVDEFDEYERLEKAGKTESEIASLIKEYKRKAEEVCRKMMREIVVEIIKKGFELSIHPDIFSFRVVDIEDVLKIAKKYGVEVKK